MSIIMMKMIVICLFLMAQSTPETMVSGIKAVYIQNKEIVTRLVNGSPQFLTNDGLRKSLPVWSKDGMMIAYLKDVNQQVALGDLVVIADNGKILTHVLIKPVASGQPRMMKYIESVEWLTDSRIAVSGSVLPSLYEVLVIDLPSGKVIADEQVDGPGIFYSPDGQQSAYEVGMPHFSPESSWKPEFVVNDKMVFPPTGENVRFVGKPAWSPESNKVAILAEDHISGRRMVVIWQEGSQILSMPIPIGSDDGSELFWSMGSLFINVRGQQLQWMGHGNNLINASGRRAETPVDVAEKLINKLNGFFSGPNILYLNYWCKDCSLSALPRRTSIQPLQE